MLHEDERSILIEEANALLERELIAEYLKPYREVWPSLSDEEKTRLLAEACTWASCLLANPAAAGMRGGFYVAHK